jgi:hypothetical protein
VLPPVSIQLEKVLNDSVDLSLLVEYDTSALPLLQLVATQELRCVVNQLFLYSARLEGLGTSNGTLICSDALGFLRMGSSKGAVGGDIQTKSIQVSLEVNGAPVGANLPNGGEARVYIIPSLAVTGKGQYLPGHTASSLLNETVDLSGSSFLNEELAKTGWLSCIFLQGGKRRTSSPITEDLRCQVPPKLSAFGSNCSTIQLEISISGFDERVRILNQFHHCPVPLEILGVVPRLIPNNGVDHNATLTLDLGQHLSSPGGDEFVCLVAYSLDVRGRGQATDAYPFDEATQSCPVRVYKEYGQIEKLAIGLRRGEVALTALGPTDAAMPRLIFEVPTISSLTGTTWLQPHGLENTLTFRLSMANEERVPLQERLKG